MDADVRQATPWSATDAAARHASLADLLAQISREALQADGLDELLQRVVDCLVQRLPVAIASIILLDDTQRRFVQEVWAGELALDVPAAESWPLSGAAGRCVRTGMPQLIADVAADADYVPGNPSVRSEYLVPIRHRTRVHGVLNLESTRTDVFTADARAAFDAVACQVAGAIHLARVVRELEAANRELARLSMLDGLTGIANRRAFDQRLDMEWQRLARERGVLSLLMIDVDHFKQLNDHAGHLAGDDCLRVLARICSASARRATDLVARYGGEELVIVMPGASLGVARRVADRLRLRIEAERVPHPASPIGRHVTVSIGVATAKPHAGVPPARLIAAADAALYAAKAGGRNSIATGRVRDAASRAALPDPHGGRGARQSGHVETPLPAGEG